MNDSPGFCEQCGAPLPAGAAFCERCGHPVAVAPGDSQPGKGANTGDESASAAGEPLPGEQKRLFASSTEEKDKGAEASWARLLWPVVGAGFVVVVIGLLVWFWGLPGYEESGGEAVLPEMPYTDTEAGTGYQEATLPGNPVDLSGLWYAEIPGTGVAGAQIVVQQTGTHIEGVSLLLDGSGQSSSFSGVVEGRDAHWQFVDSFGNIGVGQGRLRADGQHIDAVVSVGGVTQNQVLHRGHLPH